MIGNSSSGSGKILYLSNSSISNFYGVKPFTSKSYEDVMLNSLFDSTIVFKCYLLIVLLT